MSPLPPPPLFETSFNQQFKHKTQALIDAGVIPSTTHLTAPADAQTAQTAAQTAALVKAMTELTAEIAQVRKELAQPRRVA